MNKSTQKVSFLPISDEIKNRIQSSLIWDDYRNSYHGLENSQSITLKYNLDYPENMLPKNFPEREDLFKLLVHGITHVKEKLGASYCSRAIIANLPPGKEVKLHIDPGWPFTIQRRYCWVLETNENAFAHVSGESKHFKEGEIWEFDNKELHGAINQGQSNRIHLIFDLVFLEDALAATPVPFEKDSFDEKFFNLVLKKKAKTGKFGV